MLLDQAQSGSADEASDLGSGPTIGMETLCRFEWILDLKGNTLWLKQRTPGKGTSAD
jgi:hypothetical protein